MEKTGKQEEAKYKDECGHPANYDEEELGEALVFPLEPLRSFLGILLAADSVNGNQVAHICFGLLRDVDNKLEGIAEVLEKNFGKIKIDKEHGSPFYATKYLGLTIEPKNE